MGMSTREIAAAVGVSKSRVPRKDSPHLQHPNIDTRPEQRASRLEPCSGRDLSSRSAGRGLDLAALSVVQPWGSRAEAS